ncbi:MAG: carbohydrate porin [Planctomycetota bacterium]|jgi:hypothetical protein
MNRNKTALWLALCALGLLWASPVQANEDEASLRKELDELKAQVEAINAKRTQRIDDEIESYLESSDDWKSAQGDDRLAKINITAGFLAVNSNSVGQDDNSSTVSGSLDLGFNFQVTEGLDLVVDLYANTGGQISQTLAVAPTLASMFDGIGVDSSVGIRPQGGVQVMESYIRYAIPAGDYTVNMEMGMIDPRTRFLTSAFSDEYRTQFLHNEFVDPSAISWLSNQAGPNGATTLPVPLGALFWMAFGENKNFLVKVAGFNAPGEWFDGMQLYFELHWKGEIKGRPMNIKFLYVRDNFYTGTNGLAPRSDKDDNQWGFEWDYKATDKIGLWAIIAGNTEDTNDVELSASFGFVYMGVGDRADDQIGVAVGYLKANTTVTGDLPEDAEWLVEAYYKYMAAGGHFQLTPYVQYISDPAGGETEDSLFILGIRFYVPF